jgi:hypothetical protein
MGPSGSHEKLEERKELVLSHTQSQACWLVQNDTRTGSRAWKTKGREWEVEKRLGKVGTVFTPGVFTDLEPACISRQADEAEWFFFPNTRISKNGFRGG